MLAVTTAALVGVGGVAGAGGPAVLDLLDPEAQDAGPRIQAAQVAPIAEAELPTPTGQPESSSLQPRTPVVPERGQRTASPAVLRTWSGVASWYGPGFAGKRTASGEIFDPGALTAAHKTLPFGSVVRVTSQRTGRSVEVRINDRGPFVAGREIDLARAAAEAIGVTAVGHERVTLELLP